MVEITDRYLAQRDKLEKEVTKILGDDIGYGRMMQLAQELWKENLERENPSLVGGEFAYGPCVAMTVSCECERTDENPHCDWCCGSGWLTEKVKEIKDNLGGNNEH